MKNSIIIEKITKEELVNLTKEEQKDYFLETIKDYLVEELSKRQISFDSDTDIKNIIRGINITIFEYKDRKKFNSKLLKELIQAASILQNQNINFIRLNDKNLINPVYTFEDGKLIIFKIYQRTDYKEALISFINYLENTFLINNTQEKICTLKIK